MLTGIALAAGAVTLGVPARAYTQTAGRLDPVFSQYPAGERPLKIANLNYLEEEASRILRREAFAYIAAGSDNQWTVDQDRRALTASYFDPSAWSERPVSAPMGAVMIGILESGRRSRNADDNQRRREQDDRGHRRRDPRSICTTIEAPRGGCCSEPKQKTISPCCSRSMASRRVARTRQRA